MSLVFMSSDLSQTIGSSCWKIKQYFTTAFILLFYMSVNA